MIPDAGAAGHRSPPLWTIGLMQYPLRLKDLVLETPKPLDPDLGGKIRHALFAWKHLLVVAPSPAPTAASICSSRRRPTVDLPCFDLDRLPLCDRFPWP